MAASDQFPIQDHCNELNDIIDQSYRSVNQVVSALESRNFIKKKPSLSEEEQNNVEAVLDKLGKYKSKIQQLEQELNKACLAGQIRERRGRGTLNSRGESGYDSMHSLTSKELRKSDSLSVHTQVTDHSESVSAGAGVTSQDSDPEAELSALNIADDKDEEHSA